MKKAYGGWCEDRLTQEEAALILGVSDRTFRRYIDRYEESGLNGLADKRLTQISHRRAPVDEVMSLVDLYSSRHQGWNARHFHDWYCKQGGNRSYTWVKNQLQQAKLIPLCSFMSHHQSLKKLFCAWTLCGIVRRWQRTELYRHPAVPALAILAHMADAGKGQVHAGHR